MRVSVARERFGLGDGEKGDGGQSLVEIGLMLPILMIILLCVVDLGRAYSAQMAVIDVAARGARIAATKSSLADAQNAVADKIEIPATKITVSAPNGWWLLKPVLVQTETKFVFITPFVSSLFGEDSLTLHGSASEAVAQ